MLVILMSLINTIIKGYSKTSKRWFDNLVLERRWISELCLMSKFSIYLLEREIDCTIKHRWDEGGIWIWRHEIRVGVE